MKKLFKKTCLAAALMTAAVLAAGVPAMASDNDSPLDFGATEFRYPDGTLVKVPEYDWHTVEPAPDLAENMDNSNDRPEDYEGHHGNSDVVDYGGENS